MSCVQLTHRRRGSVIVYSVIAIVVICGFASLAVDYGRAQLVKTELRRVTDAAALYAAGALPTAATCRTWAQSVANENPVDGSILTLQAADVEVGNWNTTTRVFTVNGAPTNAVRVYGRKLASRGTAVPLMFARLLGRNSVDITVSAIAQWTSPQTITRTVSGKGSITYYGLANGTFIPDTWGGDTMDNSMRPTEVTVTPGQTIYFSTSGTVACDTSGNTFPAEGAGWYGGMQQPQYANSNGFSDVIAGGVALGGAFVGTGSPPVPSTLDFSSQAARDVTRVSPALKQQFHIGSGTQTNGSTRGYVVPANANKLLLGITDSWIWRDNSGSFSVTMTLSGTTKLVK